MAAGGAPRGATWLKVWGLLPTPSQWLSSSCCLNLCQLGLQLGVQGLCGISDPVGVRGPSSASMALTPELPCLSHCVPGCQSQSRELNFGFSSRINHLTRGHLNLKLKRDFSKSSPSSLRQLASPSPLVGAGGGWCLLCGNATHSVVVNSRYNWGRGISKTSYENRGIKRKPY